MDVSGLLLVLRVQGRRPHGLGEGRPGDGSPGTVLQKVSMVTALLLAVRPTVGQRHVVSPWLMNRVPPISH